MNSHAICAELGMRVVLVALLLWIGAACATSPKPPPDAADATDPPTRGTASNLPTGAMRATSPMPEATDVVVVSDGATAPGAKATSVESIPVSGEERIDCGDLAVSGTPPRARDADSVRAASACFLKALDLCQAATLTIRERGTGVVRQFSIERADKCELREALQPDPNSPPALVDCKTARMENNALVIASCSHFGDFVLAP